MEVCAVVVCTRGTGVFAGCVVGKRHVHPLNRSRMRRRTVDASREMNGMWAMYGEGRLEMTVLLTGCHVSGPESVQIFFRLPFSGSGGRAPAPGRHRRPRRPPGEPSGAKDACPASQSAPTRMLDAPSASFSSGVNALARLRNLNPSGDSRLNPLPRPGTTSSTNWVCFQASNCDPEIQTCTASVPVGRSSGVSPDSKSEIDDSE